MFHRLPVRLLGVAILGAGLVSAGASAAAVRADDLEPSTAGFDGATAPFVVDLADGDRVRIAPASGAGHRVLEPLPRADGSTPGLVVTTDERGTTVQTTDSEAAPTLIAGRLPSSPAAAEAEELVELRLDAIARDGRDGIAYVNIIDVATGAVAATRRLPGDPGADCTSAPSSAAPCILVPRGTYSLMALVTTMPQDKASTANLLITQNLSLVGDPELAVTRDRSFTFDARLAEKVVVRTPGHRTKVNDGGAISLGYTRTAANGEKLEVAQHPPMMLDQAFYMQPTEPVRLGALDTFTRLRLEAPDIELSSSRTGPLGPDYYDRVWFSDVSSQFPVYDGRDRLRVVDVGHATAEDLDGLDLRGSLAIAERSDTLSVADQSNSAAAAGAELVAIYNDGPGDNGDPGADRLMLDVPTLRLSRADGRELLGLRSRDRVTVRGTRVTPYVFDMVIREENGIPDDLVYTARTGRRGNLSTQIRRFHGQPDQPSTFAEVAYPWLPGSTSSLSFLMPLRGGAQSRTEYRLADPDVRWSFATITPESSYNNVFPGPDVLPMRLRESFPRSYAAGEVVRRPVGAAPVTAAPDPLAPIERSGDRMRIQLAAFMDADGNHGTAYTDDSGMSTRLAVRADGQFLGEVTGEPAGIAQLPPGESEMAISFTAINPQSWTELSTLTDTEWTFDSRPVPVGEVEAQPVILADYDVDVDLRNRTRSRTFDLELSYLDGSNPARITDVSVDASYDDGETWQEARMRPRRDGRHRVVLPPGRGFVSLRLQAADDDGSALDQRIVRAWMVR